MKSYKISEKAILDLEGIWFYTLNNWSAEQADRYYNLLIHEFEYLAFNPESSQNKDYIKGYRSSQVKSHLIFYKIANQETIEIIRILHHMMDVDHKF